MDVPNAMSLPTRTPGLWTQRTSARFGRHLLTLGAIFLLAASTGFAQTPAHYLIAYDGTLQGSWVRSCWEASDGALFTNFAATAPGRAGNAIEVRFGANDAWCAFGLADRKPGWDRQFKYLNEFRTIEFDVYLESDSAEFENLTFVFEDAGFSDNPTLGSFIPGWAGLSSAQRVGTWLHATVNLASLHPTLPRFHQFLLFNNGSYQPHFRIMNVKLGWDDDTTPPVVTPGTPSLNTTYDQLSLPFTTNEATIYRVEYGIGNYGSTITGNADDWSGTHTAVLTGLTRGSTYQYRIVALDHRTDPAATPNQGSSTGTYAIPATPTTPPVISSLAVGSIAGNRATLTWTTDRPCTAQVTYHKTGGSDLTRTLADLTASRSVVLDLLEPATTYAVTVTATDAFNLSATQSTTVTTGATSAAAATITANPAASHAISPWIYGMNFYQESASDVRHLTLNRQGGNRWTAYNWENNYSNAGSDWGPYSSDTYLSSSTTPAEALRPLVVADRARGNASLITLQMQGYVAADAGGNVNINDPSHLANRFKQVVFKKGSAFTITPSTADASVYMDEFLWALDQKITGDIYADSTTPTLINLDNEPELWPSTHAEIQTGAPTVTGYIQKTVDLCKAIKDLAPAAKTLGPVHYGFNGIVNWQGAAGFSDTYWFTDRYLTDLKAASQTYGRRLLDAYDFHWYSEAQGSGTRITDLTGPTLTDAQIQAIVQSPRSLWDPTYRETSWIADSLGGPVRILDRIQQKIDAIWPGTGIAITEYDNGGDNHIAGAIAQADNLGVFGQRGVYAACFWPMSDAPYIRAGFRMYRDYDGNLGSFGDTSIPTTSSDPSKVAAYVSRDSTRAGRYVVVALNRSSTAQDIGFSGLAVAGAARVYRIAGTSPTPAFVGEVPVNLASWVVTLPALSVSTIEITAADSSPVAPTISAQPQSATVTAGTGVTFSVAASGTAPLSYQWRKDGTNLAGATTNTCSLAGAQSSDAGSYTVVVTNTAGSVTSAAAILTVNPAVVAPTISAQPTSRSVTVGSSTSFTVAATGTAPLTDQWQRSTNSGSTWSNLSNDTTHSGVTTLTLSVGATTTGMSGNQFRCVVANSANSATSNAATLTVSAAVVAPAITTPPQNLTVSSGTSASFSVSASGTGPLAYQWLKGGSPIAGAINSSYSIASAQSADAGSYSVTVSNSAGSVTSSAATLTVQAPAQPPSVANRLINLSTRSLVGTGGDIQIAGFVIQGTAAKRVVIRANGPVLTQFGVSGALADPMLEVYSGQTVLFQNDDWNSSLASDFAGVGAFPWTAGSKDAALSVSLQPGMYTVQVSGKNGGTGVALIEVYDADGGAAASKLINLSTRALVGTGGDIQIGGFVVQGDSPKKVVIRASGPALGSYGVAGTLADPVLTLYSGQTVAFQNDDWNAALAVDFAAVGAFAWTVGSKDAALVVTLQPGMYTAQVSGKNGATGVALIEVYEEN